LSHFYYYRHITAIQKKKQKVAFTLYCIYSF
jgi:hypothetical protein